MEAQFEKDKKKRLEMAAQAYQEGMHGLTLRKVPQGKSTRVWKLLLTEIKAKMWDNPTALRLSKTENCYTATEGMMADCQIIIHPCPWLETLDAVGVILMKMKLEDDNETKTTTVEIQRNELLGAVDESVGFFPEIPTLGRDFSMPWQKKEVRKGLMSLLELEDTNTPTGTLYRPVRVTRQKVSN